MIQRNVRISYVLEVEELILLNCPYYPKQYTNLMQLNLCQITHDIFHRTLEKVPQNFRTNNPKTYMEAQKVQNYIQMANKTNEKVLNITKVQSEVTQSCPTLQPMDYMVCQAPLSMGFSKLEYWTGLPFPSPGDHPDPEIKPRSSALPGRLFTI